MSHLLTGVLFISWAVVLPVDTLSTLRFSTLGSIRIPTVTAILVWSGISIIIGISCVLTARRRTPLHRWGLFLYGVGLVFMVLLWGSMGRRIDVVGLITQSLRLSTPIAIGAFSGILCERSGVINIGIEGMMLVSACIGYTVALYTQNIWIGLSGAIVGGAIMAGIHSVLSIRFRVDQIVSGVVVNILAVGITGYMRRAFLQVRDLDSPGVLPLFRIPWLSDIPAIGKILFSHQPMVYVMLVMTGFLHFCLFKTRWGLRTRSVGEQPGAADTLGVDVIRTRYANVIAAGMIAGLGGAWFSLETVGQFDDLMTGGKGFIALAAMIFGKWNPVGAFWGALLFGFVDALQIKLQVTGVDVPHQILGMAPYIVTMVVLAGVIGRAVAPGAIGVPYGRE